MNKQTVTEVASYLKNNTYYSNILEHVDTNSIHRGHLEQLIRMNFFNTYVRLLKFQSLDKVTFYTFELINQEISYILKAIMKVATNSYENSIVQLPNYLIEHSSVNMLELLKARSFKELLETLHNTPYYKILSKINMQNDEKIDYISCERELTQYYFDSVKQAVSKNFSGDVAKSLLDFFAAQADITNITNIYRLKTYFNANEEETKKVVINGSKNISKKKMTSIINAKKREDIVEQLRSTKYGKIIHSSEELALEKNFAYLKFKNAKRQLKNATDAPVAFYSFIKLCEVERMNLTKIIEGIRYNVSPEFIQNMLIL